MKILILSQYFWPQNYRINLVAEELLKKKFDLIILTSSTNRKHKKRFSNAKIYRVKAYQIRKFKLIAASIFSSRSSINKVSSGIRSKRLIAN